METLIFIAFLATMALAAWLSSLIVIGLTAMAAEGMEWLSGWCPWSQEYVPYFVLLVVFAVLEGALIPYEIRHARVNRAEGKAKPFLDEVYFLTERGWAWCILTTVVNIVGLAVIARAMSEEYVRWRVTQVSLLFPTYGSLGKSLLSAAFLIGDADG
jgi:hypothetical protein